ncbi:MULTISPECIES: hypothetical protein [unclassified Schlesneria]|uniref:hypothetical protein n=1 Tax=Schlesneria TaxID=656899 RepID=UPI002F09841D
MRNPPDPTTSVNAAGRLVAGTFGFAFAGIGISVLAFLWLTPFNTFGSPPLFFRVFGSFIALIFVVMGGTTFLAALKGGSMLSPADLHRERPDSPAVNTSERPPTHPVYSCTNCGAHLGKGADVSPLGDVKCPFCHKWFNIHRPMNQS